MFLHIAGTKTIINLDHVISIQETMWHSAGGELKPMIRFSFDDRTPSMTIGPVVGTAFGDIKFLLGTTENTIVVDILDDPGPRFIPIDKL